LPKTRPRVYSENQTEEIFTLEKIAFSAIVSPAVAVKNWIEEPVEVQKR
jgi:hypothetical protein